MIYGVCYRALSWTSKTVPDSQCCLLAGVVFNMCDLNSSQLVSDAVTTLTILPPGVIVASKGVRHGDSSSRLSLRSAKSIILAACERQEAKPIGNAAARSRLALFRSSSQPQQSPPSLAVAAVLVFARHVDFYHFPQPVIGRVQPTTGLRRALLGHFFSWRTCFLNHCKRTTQPLHR